MKRIDRIRDTFRKCNHESTYDLGDDATAEVNLEWKTAELHIRDGSGSCVILNEEQIGRLNLYLTYLHEAE